MQKFWNLIPGETVSELSIEGEICTEEWFRDETGSKEFIALLNQCKDVNVKINSPGGDVFAASEIYSALKDHAGHVTIEITAIAASAASVVAMAGDVVRIHPTAMMMIHDPMTCTFGNVKEHKAAISLLNEVQETLINAYEIKTGLDREKIRGMLERETWMSPLKALQLGFVDEVIGYDHEVSEPAADDEGFDIKKLHDRMKTSIVAAMDRIGKSETEAAAKDEDPAVEAAAGEEKKIDTDSLKLYADCMIGWASLIDGTHTTTKTQ